MGQGYVTIGQIAMPLSGQSILTMRHRWLIPALIRLTIFKRMNHEEAIRILSAHPQVAKVTESGEEAAQEIYKLGMLALHMKDGHIEGVNPASVARQYNESEQERFDRVMGFIDAQMDPTRLDKPQVDQALPLVRLANYFAPAGQLHPAAVHWLTDFIGVGLGVDKPDSIHVVNTSDLPTDRSPDGDYQLFRQALSNLHQLAGNIHFEEVGFGPDVYRLANPADYQASWFADIGTLGSILQQRYEATGQAWVCIPASRRDILIVNSKTNHWPQLLDILEKMADDHTAIMPLPFWVNNGSWQMWLPEAEPALRRRWELLKLKIEYQTWKTTRESLAEELAEDFESNIDLVVKAEAVDRRGTLLSVVSIPLALDLVSIPKVMQVAFVNFDPSFIAELPLAVLLNEFGHLVQPHEGTHPPRLLVRKPSSQDLDQMKAMGFLLNQDRP